MNSLGTTYCMIPGYSEGADITLLNTIYTYPQRNPENNKYENDKMIILYKDNVTGEKKIHEILNPDYTFYAANDDFYLSHHLFFIEAENVHPITVPFKDVLKVIAELSDNTKFFFDNIKNRNRRENEKLHTLPNIFGSDIHIEDAYRLYFDLSYKNRPIPITKAYFDIEVDTIDMAGDFPELGECPINALTYIDTDSKVVSTFLLRDENIPQIQELEDEVKKGIALQELKAFVINHVGGREAAQKHDLLDFNYDIYFYDEEIQLIVDTFRLIHTREPDFLLAWNMSFDIPYINERIKFLGYDPGMIMSHPEAISKISKYYIDIENKALPAQRGDFFTINGKTIYLDQVVHFASRRKGQSSFDNLKLDYIGQLISNVGKLSFEHIAKNFAEFPRVAYKLFYFYNVMDTIVQHCVENKVNDIGYVFNKCLLNNTRYHKAHRQTVYLTNRGVKEFRKAGYILGNNNNRNNEKPPKFPGAHVGDPINNTSHSKIRINGAPINVVNNADDFDYKALYPSIMVENNIAPNSQIGKINIDQVVYDKENPFRYGKYCRSGQFIEDFRSNNYISFCNRWMHLASYSEFLDDMKEFFEMTDPCKLLNPLERNIYEQPLVVFDGEVEAKPLVEFEEYVNPSYSLVDFYPEPQKFEVELEHLRTHAQMDIDDIEMVLRRRERERDEDAALEAVFETNVRLPYGDDGEGREAV